MLPIFAVVAVSGVLSITNRSLYTLRNTFTTEGRWEDMLMQSHASLVRETQHSSSRLTKKSFSVYINTLLGRGGGE